MYDRVEIIGINKYHRVISFRFQDSWAVQREGANSKFKVRVSSVPTAISLSRLEPPHERTKNFIYVYVQTKSLRGLYIFRGKCSLTI